MTSGNHFLSGREMSEAPKKSDQVTFHRSLSVSSIDRTRGDDDKPDTYTFKLSSTEPVEVWRNEFEILDHSKKSVRMDFLASGNAPLLWMHSRDNQLGVIESAKIKGDNIEVTVRFGDSDFAKEKKRDVDSGILKNVSVGFRIHSWKSESEDDEVETYRVDDWEPFEASFVTIPADKSVGMGRSASYRELLSGSDTSERKKPEQSRQEKTKAMSEVKDPPKQPEVDLDQVRAKAGADAAVEERKRATGIREIASKTNIPGVDLADTVERALAEGTSLDEFRASVMDKISEAAPKLNQADIGASRKEQKRYSIQNVMDGLRTGDMEKHAGYELEVSEELLSRMGKESDAIAIPHDVILRGWIPQNPQALAVMARNYGISERDLNSITLSGSGQDDSASNLVETELLDEMFVYSLRENSTLLSDGVTILSGLVGNVDIPVELLNPAFSWVAEDAEPTEGDYTLGKASLSYKTLGAQVPFTRQASKQTTPNLEGLLARSMRIGASNGLTSALFAGTGSSGQPTGIINTAGVGSVDHDDATTRDVLIDHEIALGNANVIGEACTYMNTTLAGAFAKTKVDAGSGVFVGRYRREAGRRVLETEIGDVKVDNLVPASTIIHGVPSSLVAGMWGTLEIGIDTSTKATTGGKVIRVFLDADCTVPQAANWVVGTNVA